VQIYNAIEIKKCKKDTPCKPKTLRSVGSGAVIDHHKGLTLIITAAHVCQNNLIKDIEDMILEKNNYLEIRTWDDSLLHANILSISEDPKIDLCSIYIKSHNKPLTKLKLSDTPPITGDQVVAMAAPMGIYHPPVVPLLQGRFSGDVRGGNISIVTVPSEPGSSGAVILNDDRNIVGVIFAVNSGFNHVTLSVNYRQTRKFIEESIKLFRSKNMSTPIKIIHN